MGSTALPWKTYHVLAGPETYYCFIRLTTVLQFVVEIINFSQLHSFEKLFLNLEITRGVANHARGGK